MRVWEIRKRIWWKPWTWKKRWDNRQLKIKSVDPATGIVTLEEPINKDAHIVIEYESE